LRLPNFQTFGSQMAARLSALRPGLFLPPGRFLVLIYVRDRVDPRAIVRLEGLGTLKKSTSFRTRTSDLPACSIVPQPTTLPRRVPVGLRIFSTSFRPALGPTQSPIQWVPRVKRPGRDGDYSPTVSAEVKNTWIYTSSPPCIFFMA
jgi:hypothetical protein